MKIQTALLAMALLVGGCTTIVKHDPYTVSQVKKTIDHEVKDFERTKAVLEGLEFEDKEKALNGLRVRHESEKTRLERWLASEKAKKTADD